MDLSGMFASLQALFGILDLGLSATMNREMARLNANLENRRDATGSDSNSGDDVLGRGHSSRSSDNAAGRAHYGLLVKAGQFDQRRIYSKPLRSWHSFVALRWPVSFYTGGLMGLQRQVPVNVISSVIATVRGAGQ